MLSRIRIGRAARRIVVQGGGDHSSGSVDAAANPISGGCQMDAEVERSRSVVPPWGLRKAVRGRPGGTEATQLNASARAVSQHDFCALPGAVLGVRAQTVGANLQKHGNPSADCNITSQSSKRRQTSRLPLPPASGLALGWLEHSQTRRIAGTGERIQEHTQSDHARRTSRYPKSFFSRASNHDNNHRAAS